MPAKLGYNIIMSYSIAIHTDSGAFPLPNVRYVNGWRSFHKIQDKKRLIYWRMISVRDDCFINLIKTKGGSFDFEFELGSDFDSLVKEAIEKKVPFEFCFFNLPNRDTDDDIISIFERKVIVLPKDRKISMDIPYRIT